MIAISMVHKSLEVQLRSHANFRYSGFTRGGLHLMTVLKRAIHFHFEANVVTTIAIMILFQILTHRHSNNH